MAASAPPSVPGWAYAMVVICVVLVITVAVLGVFLHRTRTKLRNGNRVRNHVSAEDGVLERLAPPPPVRQSTRQSAGASTFSSISRVFAKDPIAKDDDLEAKSPMMADIGQSWSSPPRPPRVPSKELPHPYPYPLRNGSISSSDGGEGPAASVTSLLPAPRRVRGPRQQPTLNTASEVLLAGVPSAHASTSTIRSTVRSNSTDSHSDVPPVPPVPEEHATHRSAVTPSALHPSVSTHRSAVTPSSAVAPHPPQPPQPPRRRPSVSVNTSLDGHGNPGEWQRMPFIAEGEQFQSTEEAYPTATTATTTITATTAATAGIPCATSGYPSAVSTHRGRPMPSIPDRSPPPAYSPDSIYSRASTARVSGFGFQPPSAAPPVPALPADDEVTVMQGHTSRPSIIETKPDDEAMTPRAESARATVMSATSEAPMRRGRNTFGGGSVSALSSIVSGSGVLPEARASRSNQTLSLYSTDSRQHGHRRTTSHDESYSMPGVETTEEYDEQALLTPKTARSAKFLNTSIDHVLANADTKDQLEQSAPTPRRFPSGNASSESISHSRSASSASVHSIGTEESCTSGETNGRHVRYPSESSVSSHRGTSECSANSANTFSYPHTPRQNGQNGSCDNLISNMSNYEAGGTIDLNTPRSSMYDGDGSTNPYMNPSVCLQPPSTVSSMQSLHGAGQHEFDLGDDSVALASVTARTRQGPETWGPPLGALKAFVPNGYGANGFGIPSFPVPPTRAAPLRASIPTGHPLPPIPGTPGTPAYTDDGSSWGTNPDMERSIFQRILAMKSSDLAPLNMAALTSLSSIQSAVPSTPGGPDVCPPDGHSLTRHASSSSLSSMSGGMPMAFRGMPTAAAAAAFLSRLRIESEELNTPSTVQPPDWDVRMWTSANVDGTL